jgi:hypothetical protein
MTKSLILAVAAICLCAGATHAYGPGSEDAGARPRLEAAIKTAFGAMSAPQKPGGGAAVESGNPPPNPPPKCGSSSAPCAKIHRNSRHRHRA